MMYAPTLTQMYAVHPTVTVPILRYLGAARAMDAMDFGLSSTNCLLTKKTMLAKRRTSTWKRRMQLWKHMRPVLELA
jgi:hypothetical protein